MTIIDLNDIAGGKLDRDSFTQKVNAMDWEKYKDQEVGIRGCAPTWAHLLVAGRLFGRVKRLSFVMDDGKGGVPIQVF